MKTNWQIKKLNEICDKGSSNISQNQLTKEEGIYPIYGAGGLIKKISFFQRDKDYISIIKDGAGIGRVSLLPAKSSVIGTLQYIIPKENINLKFLYYIMNSFDFSKYKNGATIPHIYFKEYSNEQFVIPPLSEQARIVKIIDEAFEKIEKAKENAEKNLQNSKALFDSYLQKIFTNKSAGWKIKNLKEVSEYFIGLTYSPKDVNDQGIIVLRSSNIQNDKLDFSDIVRVNRPVKENLKVKEGDILMCSRNGSKRLVGKTALIQNLEEVMTFGTFMMIVRGQYNPYLYWFFKSSNFRKQILGGENTMINQITRYMLDAVILSFPPQEKQGAIVKKLDELSNQTKKLELLYKKKLTDLEELKKSVLKKAFNGELITSDEKVIIKTPILSPYIRNQVHAAIIDQVIKDGGWTTEVAVAKYDHLLQEVFGLSLGYQFQTQQFGPFDAQIKKLIFSGLGRNKWFTKKNGMIVFGSNINALLFRQSNIFHNAQSKMKELAKLGVTKLDAEKVELLSTVCHSIKEMKSTAFDKVRAFMSEWATDGNRTKAEKFSSEQIQKCLDFIIKNGLDKRLTEDF